MDKHKVVKEFKTNYIYLFSFKLEIVCWDSMRSFVVCERDSLVLLSSDLLWTNS